MKELGALCALVAATLLIRQSSLGSAWDVLMAAGDVSALAVACWCCYALHSRVVRQRRWHQLTAFIGSPFSYIYAALLLFYLVYNWNSNRPSGNGFQPHARVAISHSTRTASA